MAEKRLKAFLLRLCLLASFFGTLLQAVAAEVRLGLGIVGLRLKTRVPSLISLMLAFCLFVSFFGTFPQVHAAGTIPDFGYVDSEKGKTSAPVYDRPGGKIITYLNNGTGVSIEGQEKDMNGDLWYHIRYTPEVCGSMKASHISTKVTSSNNSANTTSSKKTGIVTKNVTTCLLVRSKPSTTGYKTLDRLYPGDKVSVLGTETSDGIKYDIVLTEKGEQGYCTSGYITTSTPTSSPSSSELTGDTVNEMGTIISPSPIYKYDTQKKCMVLDSVSFIGGERVNLKQLVTDTDGNKFYLFQFGTLTKYVPHQHALRDSEMEFHGRPGSIDTSQKGTVNKLVTSCLLERSNPSETDYTVLGRLYCGDQVTIIQTTTIDKVKWYRLFREIGPDSWVKAMYIDLDSGKKEQNTATSPNEKHEPVDGLGQIRRRTTAYKFCGKRSKEDKSFLGGEFVDLFEIVTIGSQQQYGCRFGGKVYYVDKADIITSVQPSSSAQDTSKPQNVNLQGMVRVQTRLSGRSEPSTSADVVESLFNGASVEVLETKTVSKTKWYLVRTQKGNKVWCLAAYIEIGTWKLISTGTTTSTTSSTNSRYNASLACSELDGIVILSQHKFSWVKIMGACSKDDGYKESTVFKNGKRVKGYGGGVCQVSTTINIAIKNAGIKTQAHKHSLPVSYATRDQEATVAYPSVDFSFVNTKNSELMLRLTANNGSCTCNVYMWIKK